MKKILCIMSVVIGLAISFGWLFNYISRDGEFTKWSHNTVGIEHFDDGNVVYLSYDFSWSGIGKPILEKIEFIKNDGTIVAKDDDEFSIQPFIANTGIGQLYEETVINEGYIDDLVDVEGFLVDDDFNLVLRVEFDDTNADNDISMIRITYKKYGVTQFRNIPFDTGIIMDE